MTNNGKVDQMIEQMFKAGAHFGYTKTRRHPSTSPFIYGTKNRSDIIDLEKTIILLEKAKDFAKKLGAERKTILFVGTKPEAQNAAIETASSIDMPYVSVRWVGGILTNFPEIKKRIALLLELKEKKAKGELDKYTKKERLLIDRKIERLEKYFSGIVSLKKTPDAIFIADGKHEYIAVAESKMTGVPIISLVNSDSNIKDIDYPIVGNDASVSSVAFFTKEIGQAYKEGLTSAPEAPAAKPTDK